MEQQQLSIPMIGTETACHYLAQLNAKIINDQRMLQGLKAFVVELKKLQNEDVELLIKEHGIEL